METPHEFVCVCMPTQKFLHDGYCWKFLKLTVSMMQNLIENFWINNISKVFGKQSSKNNKTVKVGIHSENRYKGVESCLCH